MYALKRIKWLFVMHRPLECWLLIWIWFGSRALHEQKNTPESLAILIISMLRSSIHNKFHAIWPASMGIWLAFPFSHRYACNQFYDYIYSLITITNCWLCHTNYRIGNMLYFDVITKIYFDTPTSIWIIYV